MKILFKLVGLLVAFSIIVSCSPKKERQNINTKPKETVELESKINAILPEDDKTELFPQTDANEETVTAESSAVVEQTEQKTPVLQAETPKLAEPVPARPAPSVPQTAAQAPAKTYAIGDTGPNGGIVFSITGGKYKEITKPEAATAFNYNTQNQNINNAPAGWKLASIPELREAWAVLHKTGKANYGNVWYRSSDPTWGSTNHKVPDYTTIDNWEQYTSGLSERESISGNRPSRGNCDAGFPMDVFHLRMSDGGVIETLREAWDGKWLIYTTLMNKSDIEAENYNNYHRVAFDNVYMLYVHSF
jgi:hypothetical protein